MCFINSYLCCRIDTESGWMLQLGVQPGIIYPQHGTSVNAIMEVTVIIELGLKT